MADDPRCDGCGTDALREVRGVGPGAHEQFELREDTA